MHRFNEIMRWIAWKKTRGDLAINKKKKKYPRIRVASRAFPSTWLIVRKARDFARPTISLLGQRGLRLEREIFERTRLRARTVYDQIVARRGIDLRDAKEERKEGRGGEATIGHVFPRNFPLQPGNQFHRTPRYRSVSRGGKIKRGQYWATRLFTNLYESLRPFPIPLHGRRAAFFSPLRPGENVDISRRVN